MRERLSGDPWEMQARIMRALAEHRRVAVRSCNHAGKTWTAACLVLWWLTVHDPALVITTATDQRQVEKQLWPEIARLHRQARLPGRILTTELTMSPTKRAYGFSTNVVERFQGWHEQNILIVADEASGIPKPIYEAIEGCLTGPNARLLLIGNPNNPSGTFYEAFRSSLYQTFHISAYDVPERLLPPGWAEEHRMEWGEDNPAYQVRVLGEFPPQGADALIHLAWVEEAFRREFDDPDEPVEIGCDIARTGNCESVAYVRRGRAVIAFDVWRGSDTMASAGRIAVLARQWRASLIKVDEIGVGAGVVDRLAEESVSWGFPCAVAGVNVGVAAADSENYFNLRTEIFQGLADRFKAGDIALPEDPVLLAQLTNLKFSFTPRGQKKLESKDDMQKRGLKSPDRADALALAYAGGGQTPVPAPSEMLTDPRNAGWVNLG